MWRINRTVAHGFDKGRLGPAVTLWLIAVPLLLGVTFYFRVRIRKTYRRVRRLLSQLNAFIPGPN